MQQLITGMQRDNRLRTAETYRSTLRSFRNFRRGHDISLAEISPHIMESYQTWLRNRRLTPNTISFYARILRATYNRAVDAGITQNRHPFRHIYTGIDKTTKRALPLPLIKRIKNLDLSDSPTLDFARDIFILSFCLRGMSIIDMAYLRKSDLSDGNITYRRRKTGRTMIIQWTPEMQQILDKHRDRPTLQLLPIIKGDEADLRSAYRKAGYNINHSLKKIAKMIGLSVPLTLYVARHSWATAASSIGIPLSVISQGMGHDSEATTRIYLADIDLAPVHEANSRILSALT